MLELKIGKSNHLNDEHLLMSKAYEEHKHTWKIDRKAVNEMKQDFMDGKLNGERTYDNNTIQKAIKELAKASTRNDAKYAMSD